MSARGKRESQEGKRRKAAMAVRRQESSGGGTMETMDLFAPVATPPVARTPARSKQAQAALAPKLPAFFYRLSSRNQRVYLKSDSIDRFELGPCENARGVAEQLLRALESGSGAATARAAQGLIDELCRRLRVVTVRLEVRGVRPHNQRGELHGIFYP